MQKVEWNQLTTEMKKSSWTKAYQRFDFQQADANDDGDCKRLQKKREQDVGLMRMNEIWENWNG